MLKDNKKGIGFPKKGLFPYVENVKVTNIPTLDLSMKELKVTPEYVGVHIDIWYDDLEHLGGQHVWIDNCIYKVKKDQPAQTNFCLLYTSPSPRDRG